MCFRKRLNYNKSIKLQFNSVHETVHDFLHINKIRGLNSIKYEIHNPEVGSSNLPLATKRKGLENFQTFFLFFIFTFSILFLKN